MAGEETEHRKVKPDVLSSIPRTDIVGEKKQLPQVVLKIQKANSQPLVLTSY